MSRWTHITACISVDTCKELSRPDMRKYLKLFLKNAPKITGSEEDAEVFVHIKKGYNISSSYSCEICKYKDTHKIYKDEQDGEWYEECDAPEGYICPWAHYQSCVVISVQGDLRDRTKEDTMVEWEAFKDYIEKEFLIRDYAINIEGE